MRNRRVWIRGVLIVGLVGLACHQIWRHGHDYVFAEQFAEIEKGKVYRGAWQKSWPMRRIIRDQKIKTIVALAHPADHPLAVQEKALADELGVKWVHIPIVDRRHEGNSKSVSDLLDDAAAVVADPKNQPVFLHCHHGLNRASMVQIAYRTRYCGWTLPQALKEIDRTFGLVTVDHGPDYHHMEKYYAERVLPNRKAGAATASESTGGDRPTATAAPAEPRVAGAEQSPEARR